MEIKEFYNEFISRFNRHKRFFESDDCREISKGDWTRGVEKYIKKIFEENLECICICKNNLAQKDDMKEFLALDYTVFKKNEKATMDNLIYQDIIYAVEHENNVSHDRIAHNISKLLNVSAKNKIMIGYVRKEEEKDEIFEKLKSQIKEMKPNRFRSDERLLVILGNERMASSSEYRARLFYLNSKRVADL